MVDRNLDTREAKERPQSWKPASLLPVPIPIQGYNFRWIRVSSRGQADNKNVSARFREGWVPVLAKDHPELAIMADRNSQFPDNVEIGGLLLCKAPSELVRQRNDYYADHTAKQMQAVENTIYRESDARMPLKVERKTSTSFGRKGE